MVLHLVFKSHVSSSRGSTIIPVPPHHECPLRTPVGTDACVGMICKAWCGSKKRERSKGKAVEFIDTTGSDTEESNSSDESAATATTHVSSPTHGYSREWDSFFFPQWARSCCSVTNIESDSDAPSDEVEGLCLTASFREEVDLIPAVVVPSGTTDLIVDRQSIPGLSTEMLAKAVMQDSVLDGYLTQFSKATDVSLTTWFDSPCVGGVRVRRATFTMPVPQDVPAAIARLAAVPETSKATLVLGYFARSPDELLIFLQQATHDVPYGSAFRVNETMAFQDAAGGGSIFSKWTSVRWVHDLPWYAAAMKPITESKTKAGSPAGGEAFLRMLREAAERN